MKILIVDDSLDKLSEITKALFQVNKNIDIQTVEDIQGAMLYLKYNTADLLILDQYLPFRKGKSEKILEDGGALLLKEIDRKADKINSPKYVIGLSQFCENQSNFSEIWKLIEYSPTHSKWTMPLLKMVKYIEQFSEEQSNAPIYKQPTLFVEGLTDLNILQRVVEIYFPEHQHDFTIESQKNAGANWVAQQLVIWGHQLNKNSKDSLVKGIGLFDYDEAGIKARQDVLKKLTSANQQESSKIVSIQAKYSKDLIEFYKHGLQIELEIESLLPVAFLKHADENGWLEYRAPLFNESPKGFDQMTETIPDYLDRISFPKELSVYLKKVKISKKETFTNYIIEKSRTVDGVLENIKALMDDILKVLLNLKTNN